MLMTLQYIQTFEKHDRSIKKLLQGARGHNIKFYFIKM